MCSLDEWRDAIHTMLDLSSAFDTIDDDIPVHRLHTKFGVNRTANSEIVQFLFKLYYETCGSWDGYVGSKSCLLWPPTGFNVGTWIILPLHDASRTHHSLHFYLNAIFQYHRKYLVSHNFSIFFPFQR